MNQACSESRRVFLLFCLESFLRFSGSSGVKLEGEGHIVVIKFFINEERFHFISFIIWEGLYFISTNLFLFCSLYHWFWLHERGYRQVHGRNIRNSCMSLLLSSPGSSSKSLLTWGLISSSTFRHSTSRKPLPHSLPDSGHLEEKCQALDLHLQLWETVKKPGLFSQMVVTIWFIFMSKFYWGKFFFLKN